MSAPNARSTAAAFVRAGVGGAGVGGAGVVGAGVGGAGAGGAGVVGAGVGGAAEDLEGGKTSPPSTDEQQQRSAVEVVVTRLTEFFEANFAAEAGCPAGSTTPSDVAAPRKCRPPLYHAPGMFCPHMSCCFGCGFGCEDAQFGEMHSNPDASASYCLVCRLGRTNSAGLQQVVDRLQPKSVAFDFDGTLCPKSAGRNPMIYKEECQLDSGILEVARRYGWEVHVCTVGIVVRQGETRTQCVACRSILG